MKHLPLNPEIFVKNRERFIARMEKNAIAIFVSNDEVPSNGDALYHFKQNSDLYWLTGITQEDSMLILFPDNPDPKFREVLVLVRPNELKEKWDGKRLRVSEARESTGIATIVWLDSIEAMLQTWIHLADSIILDSNENDRKASQVITPTEKSIREIALDRTAWKRIRKKRPILKLAYNYRKERANVLRWLIQTLQIYLRL